MAVKDTASVALTGAYQNLAALVGGSNGKIPIGTEATANKVFITILTQTADIAWGESAPNIAGHQLAAGDSMTLSGLSEIKSAWLRNTVAASVATAIITAFQNI